MTTTTTRKPRMTDEEKRARREAKKQSNLTILGRAVFKATSAVLFGIEDRNEKQPAIMHVTVIAGKVTGCHNATTGEECDGRHWSGHCCHETRVLAYEAQREHELATAEQVAPLVLGEAFAGDLQAHAVDALASQEPDVFECVYKALVFGTINHLDDIMHRAKLVECELTTNALEVLRANGRIIVRKVERGVFWVDTPDQAYRSAYYGDFAA